MSENSIKSEIDDRIWITSRVRMIAERRMLRNNFLSLLLLTYYSLFTVTLSIFSECIGSKYEHFNSMVTAATVAVLVASLVVSGFRFERMASIYRSSYLLLQELYDKKSTEEEKELRYHEILNESPNHSSADYHDFLVTHIYLEGKKVWNKGEELNYTKFMILSFSARKFALIVFVVVSIVAPIAILSGPVMGGCQ